MGSTTIRGSASASCRNFRAKVGGVTLRTLGVLLPRVIAAATRRDVHPFAALSPWTTRSSRERRIGKCSSEARRALAADRVPLLLSESGTAIRTRWPRRSADARARLRARGGVMSELQFDRAGRRRSPATMPGFLAGRAPGNKGLRYPADPPKVEEIVAVMRAAGDGAHGRRLRGLIVILWRAGLRVQEALTLTEADLDQRRGSLLVRRGKGGRRREVGMDDWGWQELQPWLELRRSAPALGATPAPPRPRRRDGARRCAADRHPTPARPHQPRHHLRLPARHRQRRDHRHRPCPPRTDDPVSASLRL